MADKTDDNTEAKAWQHAEREINKEIASRGSELSDADKEEIALRAMERYWAKRSSSKTKPKSYAIWALKNATKNARHKRVVPSESVDKERYNGDEEAAALARDAIRRAQKPVPTRRVSIELTDVKTYTAKQWGRATDPAALRVELRDLAERYVHAAVNNPGDDGLGDFAAILMALADPKFDAGLIAGTVKHWQSVNNRVLGAGTKKQQDEMFLRLIESQDPARILRGIYSLPALLRLTALPSRRDVTGRNAAIDTYGPKVAGYLADSARKSSTGQACAVLEALGATEQAVENFRDTAHQRAVRARKRSKKAG